MELPSTSCRILLLWLCVLSACSELRKAEPPEAASPALGKDAPGLSYQVDRGVDLKRRVIRLGVLNDESGPAAAIGKPFAAGKRLLAAQINAGDSGLLPAGWRVELIERDHAYNPQRAVQAYVEIKNDVLLIAHSLGSPNTMPLRPMLERDHMLALPASLSSPMAQHRYTVPWGPTYAVEAMRAVDFMLDEQGRHGAALAEIKPAIVYQQDDYGLDSLSGLKQAVAHHQLAIARETAVTSVQRDFDAVVAGLKQSGATHVLLATLPNATAGLLASAARQRYKPIWLGHSPSWSDHFFEPSVVPAANLANYHWISGLPYWGENVPGMPRFLETFQRFGKALGPPDHYLLISYMQGLLAVEIIRHALQTGVMTRDGMMAVLGGIVDFDCGGLSQPLTLDGFPYRTSVRTRILKPELAAHSWTQVGPWNSPRSLAGHHGGTPAATASAAPGKAPAASTTQ